MSVLNYAPEIYSIINGTTNTTVYLKYIGASKDPSIVFTGDKHIITHGVDLLADYHYDDTGIRGLVPSYEGSDNVIFTKEGWKVLTTSYLPMLKDNTSLSEGTLMDAKQIADYVQKEIEDGFSVNDAMLFVGTVIGSTGIIENHNTSIIKSGVTNGTTKFTDLANYKAGWSFRISTSGGAIKHGDKSVIVEIGDMLVCVSDYTSEFNLNDWSVVQTNINGTSKITLNGTELRVYSNGGSDLSFYAPTTLGSPGSILISGESSLQWKAPSAITVGTANVAKKVEKALTIGTGLLFTAGTLYDGSTAGTLNLKIAQSCNSGVTDKSSYIGGVCVDTTYLTLSGDGLLSIDANKFAGALGSLEALTSTLSLERIDDIPNLVLSSGGTRNEISIIGSNGIQSTIPKDKNLTISLLKATTTTLGGIKTGYSSDNTNRNYAVNVDDSGNAYVNVPWTDTNNTWREIRIGSKSIGDSILDILPSSDIGLSYENDITKGIATISFKLGIYNLYTGEYEYID